ncbi:chalcone isomerase family protein [Sphingobium sp.]|uniref:chalcone isomerase family protein n=1 Tax=Sphingobium sp. TaxID=1912891 RepID=UPI002C9197CD|nr:chalcone isomerase family protein [Sphingobium sp.]HUD92758.1 chalcone isomerase family protein [Sphingobium sp.]
MRAERPGLLGLALLGLGLLAAAAPPAHAQGEEGAFAPQIAMPGNQQAWRRVGQATFQHYFQPYYRAALYVSPTLRDVGEVAEALTAYQVEILWQPSELGEAEVHGYWRQALRNAAGDEDTYGRIEAKAEHWIAQLPAVHHGDRWVFSYVPDAGMTVQIGGRPVHRLVGIDLNRSLTRVWLGDRADPEPRAALLGTDSAAQHDAAGR